MNLLLEKSIKIWKWSLSLSALIPAAVALVLYLLTINHGFVLDDNLVLTSNSHIKEGFAGIGDLFKYNYAHGHDGYNDGLYRPLSLVTFAIEQSWFDLSPKASHFIQALLYALTVLLIARWLALLFGSNILAFWIALLFAVHPIHTEVTANLKSRDEIMAMLFFAGAAFHFTQWVKTPSAKALVLSAIWFFAATFSKESAVTFVAIFPLIGWYLNQDIKHTAMGSAVMLVPVAIFLLVRQNILSSLPPVDSGVAGLLQNSLMEVGGFPERLATAARIQGLYIQKLFLPWGLSHDYSYNAIPVVGLADPLGLMWILVNIGLIGLGVYGLIKKKLWSFGILFYYITIAVVANLFILIGAIAAERFVFTPSLGWCIAIVLGLSALKLADKQKAIVFGSVVVIFLALTAMRIPDWKSNFTLFTADVGTVPNSARAHYNAGSSMIEEAKIDKRNSAQLHADAQIHLRRAIEIWPDYQDAYNNLGISYMNAGDYGNARATFLELIEKFPRYVKVRYNIAMTCTQMQRFDEAELHFEAFLNANPKSNEALFYCAEAEGYQQKLGEAIEHLNKLVALEP
ncbi:MAG: tetratricopeptide repeat protein, partial [Flavobacteriales bacterium]